MASRDERFANNALIEVADQFSIPREKLFLQWYYRIGPENFKALIKHGGTDIYYEVTCPNEDSGYDIVVFEKIGETHAG